MDAFAYRDNSLFCEEAPLAAIAEAAGTPVWVYSSAAFLGALSELEAAFAGSRPLICYSVKAASNLTLLSLVAEKGMGADIVSGGELFRALKAGISPRRMVYSGVGKTLDEMRAALEADLFMFNLESGEEMELLAKAAEDSGKPARIAFRVNPDVDPRTHPYVATGLRESKFGVSRAEALELYQEAKKSPWFKVAGVDCHIGSQITETGPFSDALAVVADLVVELRAQGHSIRYLDIGGGLGVRYSDEKPPSAREYAQAAAGAVSGIQDLTLILEPGRWVSANSGALLTKVLYNKVTPYRRFVVADAAMSDLIRPSLYGAHHEIVPLAKNSGPRSLASVVGPVCESGDFLARDRALPEFSPGEVLAVMGAGAYGFSMSSNYNSRPRSPEVLVTGASWSVIRERETFGDLVRGELLRPRDS